MDDKNYIPFLMIPKVKWKSHSLIVLKYRFQFAGLSFERNLPNHTGLSGTPKIMALFDHLFFISLISASEQILKALHNFEV